MRWVAASEKDSGTATLEKQLWDAADHLRANSGLTSAQYSQPVLGIIFLRFADARFAARRAELEKTASGRRGSRVNEPGAYHAASVLFLPEEARFVELVVFDFADAARPRPLTRRAEQGRAPPARPPELHPHRRRDVDGAREGEGRDRGRARRRPVANPIRSSGLFAGVFDHARAGAGVAVREELIERRERVAHVLMPIGDRFLHLVAGQDELPRSWPASVAASRRGASFASAFAYSLARRARAFSARESLERIFATLTPGTLTLAFRTPSSTAPATVPDREARRARAAALAPSARDRGLFDVAIRPPPSMRARSTGRMRSTSSTRDRTDARCTAPARSSRLGARVRIDRPDNKRTPRRRVPCGARALSRERRCGSRHRAHRRCERRRTGWPLPRGMSRRASTRA
jgi:hypothetical protein